MHHLKIHILLFISISFLLSIYPKAYSCTIFYLNGDTIVLAGNNEDWKDPASMMWFYPATEGKHGWVKFGWGSGFPQGGMNDQGLFWDATAGPYLAMPVSEATKEKYAGPLMKKVIEECATLEEARAIFSYYYCEDLYKAQYLIGDAGHQAMIVEGDNIVQMSDDHLILTNFYHSHPELGGYPCDRYETARQMIEGSDQYTAYLIGAILEATHQDGKYPTQYSQIYELKSQSFYLFYYHNYEEFIHIDLNDELKKGGRSYAIPELFAGLHQLTPDAGESVTGNTIHFTWEGKPDFHYEILYSTDPGFPEGNTITLPWQDKTGRSRSSLILGLAGFIFLLISNGRNIKWHPIGSVILLVALLTTCTREETAVEDEPIQMTQTVTDIQSGTTYYWKVRAHPLNSDDFWSETVVRSFISND